MNDYYYYYYYYYCCCCFHCIAFNQLSTMLFYSRLYCGSAGDDTHTGLRAAQEQQTPPSE